VVKRAAIEAIAADINQYAITWGARDLREAIASKVGRMMGVAVDPETEVTVTCGATEGMLDALLALVDPGDEVVIFEPFYENYGPDAILCGAVPRYVRLHPPDWSFDAAELAASFGPRTRAVILNTPHNPTGKVFSPEEIAAVGALANQWDAVILTDEIYEHITFDGRTHVSPLQMPELRKRTVVVNSISKTYSLTGWRVGWVIAPPGLTGAIRKVHDFVTVGAAAPLQAAAAIALGLPPDYYADLAHGYTLRRDRLLAVLDPLPLRAIVPYGAYYVMAGITDLGFADDVDCARHLIQEIGVATVPGSSFYADAQAGRDFVRFCFCKRDETLRGAEERLRRLAA
jgi:aminotransferase